ncbi:MAG: methyltransferase domain-containing protein [Gemmatimonadetes bacterium]|nr:methyltransferase domain-containing protein [Gemmatimonadota bacterium]
MPGSSAELAAWLVPARRRGIEHLDDPRAIAPELVLAELRDVARANRLFGGTSAVVTELLDLLDSGAVVRTLLDVGTGIGDIPCAARRAAAARGLALEVMGIELSEPAARAARDSAGAAAVADAFRLPFADRSVDVVTCSQVLHHFDADAGARLLRELDRVARVRVIVSEIRRSWLAAAGVWLASFPLGFHANSRRDGVTSVMRGFTAAELDALARGAVARVPMARKRAGFRVTVHWAPAPPS